MSPWDYAYISLIILSFAWAIVCSILGFTIQSNWLGDQTWEGIAQITSIFDSTPITDALNAEETFVFPDFVNTQSITYHPNATANIDTASVTLWGVCDGAFSIVYISLGTISLVCMICYLIDIYTGYKYMITYEGKVRISQDSEKSDHYPILRRITKTDQLVPKT